MSCIKPVKRQVAPKKVFIKITVLFNFAKVSSTSQELDVRRVHILSEKIIMSLLLLRNAKYENVKRSSIKKQSMENSSPFQNSSGENSLYHHLFCLPHHTFCQVCAVRHKVHTKKINTPPHCRNRILSELLIIKKFFR